MTQNLFVYGSLMPELKAAPFGLEERLRLAAESKVIGAASVAATLYDFGDYPGLATPPALPDDRTHGTLLRLFSPEATFRWLDEYEDFDPSRPDAQNYYLRKPMPALLGERSEMAWVYMVRRVPPGSHRISTGKWHAPSPKLGV